MNAMGLNLSLGIGLGGASRVNSALSVLRTGQGIAISFIDDAVAVQDNATPSNNFVGTMAQALARGILVYSSPSTKYVRNPSGVWTAGTSLRCHYSTTGVPLGILSEPARTNLLLNSAALATQSVTVSATAYTLSFEGTGTVTLSGASTAGPLVGTGATDRVSLTFTPSAGSLTLTVSGTVNYANLEAGLFRTSPIVTAGSAVARAADNLYVDLTKIPFGAEYTVIAHAQPSPDSATNAHVIYTVGDNTVNERHRVSNGGASGANLSSVWRTGNVAQAEITATGAPAATAFKVATATKADDFEFVVNGTSRGTDTSGTIPASPTRLMIGHSYLLTTHWAAPIGFLALIPERLSQAEMIARTA